MRVRENPNDLKRGESNKNSLRIPVLKRMFSYILKHPVLMIFALILMLTSNLLALLGPDLSGDAINLVGAESVYEENGTLMYVSATDGENS